jgi:hypothetical protein
MIEAYYPEPIWPLYLTQQQIAAGEWLSVEPGDQYAVGFYDGPLEKIGGDRHLVVDGDGKQFRNNGFRRVEPITDAEGRWLIERFDQFKPFWHEEDENGDDKLCGKSVWDWLTEKRASYDE